MISNYLKIALRNIFKHKGYSLINIIGLAVGMSCFVLIAILVRDEFSFDRFHERADRIYRLTLDAQIGETFLTAKSSGPLARSLREDVPGVEASTRVRIVGDHSMRYGDRSFTEFRLYLADSSIFRIFTFSVVEGDLRAFLTMPSTIVITDVMARKYFGDAPALGKTLVMDGSVPYMVCGVVKPLPKNSHWHFNSLVSSWPRSYGDEEYWIGNSWYTYVLLRPGVPPGQVESAFQSIVETHVRPLLKQFFSADWKELEARGMHYRYRFQRLTDIHLYSHLDEEFEPTGAISTVMMFIMIALLILAIACINFMNLNTARSAHRAKEIGVRKVLGASVASIVLQLTKRFTKLVLIANFIAWPVAYYGMQKWLDGFAYRTEIDVTAFFGAGLLALAIAVLTISYHAIRAAVANPVEALRYE